jgi:hypothetical protein
MVCSTSIQNPSHRLKISLFFYTLIKKKANANIPNNSLSTLHSIILCLGEKEFAMTLVISLRAGLKLTAYPSSSHLIKVARVTLTVKKRKWACLAINTHAWQDVWVLDRSFARRSIFCVPLNLTHTHQFPILLPTKCEFLSIPI